MMTSFINQLSKIITEDPNIYDGQVLLELDLNTMDLNKPLTSNEIQQQAKDISPNKDTDKQVNDQIKKQQEAQKKADQVRKKALEPQFKALQQNVKNVSTNIAKSAQNIQTGTDSMTDLDSDLASINSLVTNLQKTV